MIFLMCLEVLCEAVDTFCQECDLHFWRASIGGVLAMLGHDVLF